MTALGTGGSQCGGYGFEIYTKHPANMTLVGSGSASGSFSGGSGGSPSYGGFPINAGTYGLSQTSGQSGPSSSSSSTTVNLSCSTSPTTFSEYPGVNYSRVRGTCCTFTDKDYGFLRFFAGPGTDLEPGEAFFHRKDGPPDFDYGLLPSRDFVFEFTLAEDRGEKLAARDVQLVANYSGHGPVRRKGPQAEPVSAGRDAFRIAAAH